MNLQDMLQLLERLHALGAKHFKCRDLEVSFTGAGDVAISVAAPVVTPEAPSPPPAYSPENTQKVQEMIDLLKMKDEDLANQIFPEGA